MDIKATEETYWRVFLGLIVLVAVVVFFTSCESGGTGGVSAAVKKVWDAPSNLAIARDVKQTTPKGISVYSRVGLSQDFLIQADEALTELFADVAAAYPGQADPPSLNFAIYDIYEPNHDCIPSPEMRVPSFYVKDGGLGYDGSQWDQYDGKDGKSVVMAPEQVFGMTTNGSTAWGGPARAMMMVCPDPANWRNSIRYGAEHNVAESAGNADTAANALFQLGMANRTHTSGGHPFIGSRAQGLKSAPKQDWSGFAPLPMVSTVTK